MPCVILTGRHSALCCSALSLHLGDAAPRAALAERHSALRSSSWETQHAVLLQLQGTAFLFVALGKRSALFHSSRQTQCSVLL